MLHIIVNTHNAESCAFRGRDEEVLLTRAVEGIEASLPGSGGTLRGSWVNRPSHETFLVVDAPDAHVIEETLLRAGLVGRTHSRVVSVVEGGTALETQGAEGSQR